MNAIYFAAMQSMQLNSLFLRRGVITNSFLLTVFSFPPGLSLVRSSIRAWPLDKCTPKDISLLWRVPLGEAGS